MNDFQKLALAVLALATGATCAFAQGGGPFDLSAYGAFLDRNRDLSAEGFAGLYPAGHFLDRAAASPQSVSYFDRVDSLFKLTPCEKTLLSTHGFVVTERLTENSFGSAFLDIYHADLPVYVSPDAILHAYHMSYDAILQDAERTILIPTLDSLLTILHTEAPDLETRYAASSGMKNVLKDVDLYVTIALRLLGRSVQPYYTANGAMVMQIETLVAGEQPAGITLFGETQRTVDFSQFTPRGHYVDELVFQRYFRAMMWMGRIEFYASAPTGATPRPADADVQRQTIAAVVLTEMLGMPATQPLLARIEDVLRAFVGDQDNITTALLREYVGSSGISSAAALVDSSVWRSFQQGLLKQSYAVQRINSQILWSDPMSPDAIQPAAAFLPLGQRFIVDSYVTSNVVYDRIMYQGQKVRRMLPSSLDILFALGNDAAGRLLIPEFARYPYASNLASLRYLIDGYDQEYWDGTLYNGWLNAIRTLSPPKDRTGLPEFMQTAAWWQKGMNAQLASWAELRHDNLLYAKQSYTGGVICSYPESYVEPVPAFYGSLATMARNGERLFSSGVLARVGRAADYFKVMAATMDTLGGIAGKELAGVARTEVEKSFLHRMIYQVQHGCAPQAEGWYARLYYSGEEALTDRDIVVADVHTAPTDADGAVVGWVMHAGTGPVNLGVFVAPCSNGTPTAYAGPVASYYEHVTLNFKRLTDDEWKYQYVTGVATRPSWVNLYLADAGGSSRGPGATLLTGVEPLARQSNEPSQYALAQNYPNPFNPSTLIGFSVPAGRESASVQLTVYDVRGARVRQLVDMPLPAGGYTVRWDGTSDAGAQMASGVFFYELRAGAFAVTRSMMLLR
jgi:hypothetical protein